MQDPGTKNATRTARHRCQAATRHTHMLLTRMQGSRPLPPPVPSASHAKTLIKGRRGHGNQPCCLRISLRNNTKTTPASAAPRLMATTTSATPPPQLLLHTPDGAAPASFASRRVSRCSQGPPALQLPASRQRCCPMLLLQIQKHTQLHAPRKWAPIAALHDELLQKSEICL